MSMRYKGSILSATPPATSSTSASGAWTLEQQGQAQAAGTWPDYRLYIEDYFSTYLYTGNDGTQTVTTGLNVSANSGLIWIKSRKPAADTTMHALTDTVRGAGTGTSSSQIRVLATNSTNGSGGAAPASSNDYLSAFTTTGFTVVSGGGGDNNTKTMNRSTNNYVAWSFRKQSQFFDVVSWTGDGASRAISHSLGVVPGCIIVKRYDNNGEDWVVYHRSLPGPNYFLKLNQTAAQSTSSVIWDNTAPTSSVFYVGNHPGTNASGGSYIAYLFANVSTTDGLIQCGSYTGTGVAGNAQTIGWEPQWVLVKKSAGGTGDWFMVDTMRGFSMDNDRPIYSNQGIAEDNGAEIDPTSTGFSFPTGSNLNTVSNTYVYVAIRRGPMRTPTTGTSVFSPNAFNAVANTVQTTNFPIDWQITVDRNNVADKRTYSRITGVSVPGATGGKYMSTNTTDAEASTSSLTVGWNNTGFQVPSSYASTPFVAWNFRRAPGFFDVVCYSGTSATTSFSHNLAVAPELIIVKRRNDVATWPVGTLFSASTCKELRLDTTDSATNSTYSDYFGGQPTSTTFTMASSTGGNLSGSTYVAYLFASCPGVSKVGSYTGTGATQTINCGFTGGARFVMIKRTDSTGDWWVWDTARGMVAGTDPRSLFNNTNAETNANWVYTATTGFQIVTSDATVNASGGTYIYLAIA